VKGLGVVEIGKEIEEKEPVSLEGVVVVEDIVVVEGNVVEGLVVEVVVEVVEDIVVKGNVVVLVVEIVGGIGVVKLFTLGSLAFDVAFFFGGLEKSFVTALS